MVRQRMDLGKIDAELAEIREEQQKKHEETTEVTKTMQEDMETRLKQRDDKIDAFMKKMHEELQQRNKRIELLEKTLQEARSQHHIMKEKVMRLESQNKIEEEIRKEHEPEIEKTPERRSGPRKWADLVDSDHDVPEVDANEVREVDVAKKTDPRRYRSTEKSTQRENKKVGKVQDMVKSIENNLVKEAKHQGRATQKNGEKENDVGKEKGYKEEIPKVEFEEKKGRKKITREQKAHGRD